MNLEQSFCKRKLEGCNDKVEYTQTKCGKKYKRNIIVTSYQSYQNAKQQFFNRKQNLRYLFSLVFQTKQ
jgi:hypothetical protein